MDRSRIGALRHAGRAGVSAARKALDTGDINLVLAWTQKSDDKEIRNAFDKARAVRKAGGPAKELADAYFFEHWYACTVRAKAHPIPA